MVVTQQSQVVITKASAKTAAQATSKTAQHVKNLELPILLPYGPGYQFATNGGKVPYKVFDGVNLKNRLIMQAERLEGKGKGPNVDKKANSKLTQEDIPTAKSGKFNDFFNSLSVEELDQLWKNKKVRKKIERQFRYPGGLHEWHLVSRAP